MMRSSGMVGPGGYNSKLDISLPYKDNVQCGFASKTVRSFSI